jgi:hypothetical protein
LPGTGVKVVLTEFPVATLASQLTLVFDNLWRGTEMEDIFYERVRSIEEIPIIDYSRKVQQWVSTSCFFLQIQFSLEVF